MKTLATTLALIITLGSVCAQSFSQLDEDQVFHELKFGSSPESIKGQLRLDLTISYGTSYYKYSGKLLKYIQEFKTEDVNLGFHDDMLIYIDIYFNKMSITEFDELKDRLEKHYGPSSQFTAIDRGVINAIEWKGKNLTMQLYRYGREASDFADKNKTVLVISKN